MPITKSVKKALRQSEKKRKINTFFKKKIKKVLKKFLSQPSGEALKQVQGVLDKAKKRGIYHKNKVARLKSNLSKKVQVKVEKKSTEKKAGVKMSKSK